MQACKVVKRSSLAKPILKQKLMTELMIHRQLKHPSICHFQHFFEDKDNIYMLLELCPYESLLELLKRRIRLHELEVQYFSIQLISAFKYLKTNKIIHRDLKPANILLGHDLNVKISDFGISAKLNFSGERRSTHCGTPNYMAPE